ncbi:MAG: hypothetical protein QOI95_2209 [Acidimicrobiaceae bacterium]|jgi:glycosyltransferase involved in cell wall biosynthesis
MVDEPAVSIVIPSHDRVERLQRAIRGLLAQTYTDWEAIVVDDLSRDDIAMAVASFNDDRLRCVRRLVNGGVAAAQNTGLEQCVGRYVAFLHSDDEWLPSRLAQTVPVLDAATSDIGVVECGREVVYADRVDVRLPYLVGATDRTVLSYRAGVHIVPLLMRREIAVEVGFDEGLRHAEDRDFVIRLLRRTVLAFVNEPLVRIHKEEAGLRDGDKRRTYRYLMAKYADDLAADPSLHAAWWLRLARVAAGRNDAPLVREAIRAGVSLYPRRARRWPLFVASYLPNRWLATSVQLYERAAGRQARG